MGYFLFIIFGYLSGSILFARLIPKFFCHIDVCEISEDHNPGTFNVFRHVGVGLGILVILLELAKGFVPVFFGWKVSGYGAGSLWAGTCGSCAGTWMAAMGPERRRQIHCGLLWSTF